MIDKDLHEPTMVASCCEICTVTMRGRKYQILTTEDPNVGGICEQAADVPEGETPKILVSETDGGIALELYLLHELIHAYFQHEMTEEQVDKLSEDLHVAMFTFRRAMIDRDLTTPANPVTETEV